MASNNSSETVKKIQKNRFYGNFLKKSDLDRSSTRLLTSYIERSGCQQATSNWNFFTWPLLPMTQSPHFHCFFNPIQFFGEEIGMTSFWGSDGTHFSLKITLLWSFFEIFFRASPPRLAWLWGFRICVRIFFRSTVEKEPCISEVYLITGFCPSCARVCVWTVRGEERR